MVDVLQKSLRQEMLEYFYKLVNNFISSRHCATLDAWILWFLRLLVAASLRLTPEI